MIKHLRRTNNICFRRRFLKQLQSRELSSRLGRRRRSSSGFPGEISKTQVRGPLRERVMLHFVHVFFFFSLTCKCGATTLDVSRCFLFTSALLLVSVRKRVAVSASGTRHRRRVSSHVYKRSATTTVPPHPPSPQTTAVEANKLNLRGSDASPSLPV